MRGRGALAPVARVSVAGKLHPDAVKAITALQDQVEALLAHAHQVQAAGYISKAQADALYGPKVMQRELSANGSAPLNVGNLLGVLVQVQP